MANPGKDADQKKGATKERPRARMIYIRERLKEMKNERKVLLDEMKTLKEKLGVGKGKGAKASDVSED